jgi:uncharacterized repeat protein (TIGR03803 family)
MIINGVRTIALLFIFFLCAFFVLPVSEAQASITKLHEFSSATGSSPTQSLILDSSKFYGVTSSGGNNGDGVIFSINTDGTGYTVLHHFDSATGSSPGGIILAGSTLYGVANSGGNNGDGVIYSISTNGTGYTVLHHCASATGSSPTGELVYDSGTLYGTSSSGGTNNNGTVFTMQSNGSGYTVLHSFDSATEGDSATSGLTKVGSVLYGTTNFGGSADNKGTLFSINTNGSSFSVLHAFDGALQGGTPQNQKLIIDGSKIYGQTYDGGSNDTGTIFSINTNGTGFSLLKSFNASTGLLRPTTPLLFESGILYGGTQEGGEVSNNMGGYFSIQTDGSNYTEVATFVDTGDDGISAKSRPILISGSLYGTTNNGGANSGGVLFTNGTVSPSPTPTPTPTPAPNNSSSTSSSTNQATASPPGCNDVKPLGLADLFQMDRTSSTAKLYFTPVKDHADRYHVIYGHNKGQELYGQISAEVSHEHNDGVQSITINALDPKASYWFKVAPVNGCAVGDWSNWLEAKIANKAVSISYRWFNR